MQLIWFRTDLRVHDNSALAAAMERGPTLAVFIVSPKQWLEHDDSPNKVDFWLRNLEHLKTSLAKLHVPLLICHVEHWQKVPKAVLELCQEHHVETVHVNEEYGVNETRRDQATQATLEDHDIAYRSYLDQLFFSPGSVLTKTDKYFQVFSQFRKVCYQRFQQSLPSTVGLPKKQPPLDIDADPIPADVPGFATPSQTIRDLWPAGEEEARQRLEHFASDAIDYYLNERDLPNRPGTSQLSAYLAAGVISPRQCLHAAIGSNKGEFETGSVGAVTWINELLWREFYKHILVGYPRVSMHRTFRQETEALPWRNAPSELKAWQEGRTGLPIIDAAMRQLVTTGWMHNRLRMVTAMFLTKNLLISWREGERFFMQHLIDGDLSANNGGWQWSSSTGTDSVPYFRIFNPLSQSERFDKEGLFIKKWVPELKDLNKKEVHNPGALEGLFSVKDYPKPIVDLKKSRERALTAFKNLPRRQTGD